LEASGGDGKVAVVSLLAGVDTETAVARLRDANGNVRRAAQ
jgi:N-acetylmuramic acid 6-phosphate (MurNAc-6-P) etherase